MATIRKGRSGAKRRRRARRVRIGAPDPSLTPCAGVEAIRELDRALGLRVALDAGIGRVKERDRGLSAGGLLLSLASCQMAGGDHLVSLDRRRDDVAGQLLEPVPTPAPTTAAGIARRFTREHVLGVERAIAAVNTQVVDLVAPVRAAALLKEATIDADTTDVEVYGATKVKAVHAHTGARTLRPHIAFWAEAGVPVAADLLGGRADPRASCVDLLDRALAALPPGVGQVRARWDAGYFAAHLARACQERGVKFAIGAKRSVPAFTAAQAHLHWVPAVGMEHTEVAVVPYTPGTWPTGVACIARRTRIPTENIPSARARKRRTIPAGQLALALGGKVEHVYGYSFILTNLDVATDEDLAMLEWWYRHRTDIEALNRDAEHGAALRHLPSADHTVNTVWMWAALLACAITAWLQELTGIDAGNGRGRRTLTRLRRELITTPARITRRAGAILLRLPPGDQLLATVLPRLRRLPTALRPG